MVKRQRRSQQQARRGAAQVDEDQVDHCSANQFKTLPSSSEKIQKEFVWKKVNVSERVDDDDNKSSNHYDNASLEKLADKDLEASGQESVGIFFGLEVLDGNSYRMREDPLTKQRFMVPVESQSQDNHSMKAENKQLPRTCDEQTKNEKKERSPKPSTSSSILPFEARNERKRKRTNRKEDLDDSELGVTKQEGQSKESSKKAKKKKKNVKSEEAMILSQKREGTEIDDEKGNENRDAQILNLQTSWSCQIGGVALHQRLCSSLLHQGFWSPTPIQAAVLPAAILGRRNIVGAAPTGSGKTLAFLLPIGQYLLEEEEMTSMGRIQEPPPEQGPGMSDSKNHNNDASLRALILTPTRELAIQIKSESDKLLGKDMTATLVGGLAHAKQIRVLEKKRPPIVVATPGRLWEMMSSRDYAHLNDLSQIRFLVIDEADRMIQQGSFPQLALILDAVQRANPMDDEDDSDNEEDDGMENDDEESRLLGLPGVPGEAKLVMLSDNIISEIERQRSTQHESGGPDMKELDDEEFDAQVQQDEEESDNDSKQISLPPPPPVQRQTFVYSATLTLPASANYSKNRLHKKKPRFLGDVDGAIAEILEKSRAKGKTKVVDLSNVKKKKEISVSQNKCDQEDDNNTELKTNAKGTFRLPDGLTLQQIKCTQRHKDSHLYAYLTTTVEGSSGPCLVFCNSIAAVRRVGETLKILGLDVRTLHAQMQQRARFKSVELLKDSKKQTVVVATDVAARGLDIPSVASVVHYDAARTVDAFIHRSGRTARGVGPLAVGVSLSLVAPDEDKMHTSIFKSLNLRFETVSMDGRLLREAQERVSLASKVAEVENAQHKSQRQNQWLIGKAADAGLEVDDDLLDEGLSGGDLRTRNKLNEAHRARQRLAVLLSQPMKTQRFGKFLSTNSALKQKVVFSAPSTVVQKLGRTQPR